MSKNIKKKFQIKKVKNNNFCLMGWNGSRFTNLQSLLSTSYGKKDASSESAVAFFSYWYIFYVFICYNNDFIDFFNVVLWRFPLIWGIFEVKFINKNSDFGIFQFFQVSGGIQIPTCTKCSGSVYPGQNLFLESTAEGVLPGQFIIQPTEVSCFYYCF